MTALLVENLRVRLGSHMALDGIGFAANAGEIVALIGPNGAGKTTLLRAVLGLVPHEAGRIALENRDTRSIPSAERAKMVAYLPQSAEVHWPLSVERLVALGRLPHLDAFHSPGEGDQEVIEKALFCVDAMGFRGRDVHSLSGGERARVLLARALAVEAPLLFADEPVAALDPRHQLILMELFRKLAGEGRTIIIVLHDLALAARFADKICLLDRGKMVSIGPAQKVLSDENMAQVYGVSVKRDQGENGAVMPWKIVR
jgi:iron complex transport system ATP-binding protein